MSDRLHVGLCHTFIVSECTGPIIATFSGLVDIKYIYSCGPSVPHLSVCLSHARWYCIETAGRIELVFQSRCFSSANPTLFCSKMIPLFPEIGVFIPDRKFCRFYGIIISRCCQLCSTVAR